MSLLQNTANTRVIFVYVSTSISCMLKRKCYAGFCMCTSQIAETKTGIKATCEREGGLVGLFARERTATEEGFEGVN